ncbi:MAG: hypothetical protein R3A45_05000 [Bdellovibrionota bacterium]
MHYVTLLLIHSLFWSFSAYANDDLCVESKYDIKDGTVIDLKNNSHASGRYTIVERSDEVYQNTQCSMSIKIQKPKNRYGTYFQEYYGDVIEFLLRNVEEENQSCEYCTHIVIGERHGYNSFEEYRVDYCDPIITHKDTVIHDGALNTITTFEEDRSDFQNVEVFEDPFPPGQDNILRYEHNGEPVLPEDSIPNKPPTEKPIIPDPVEELFSDDLAPASSLELTGRTMSQYHIFDDAYAFDEEEDTDYIEKTFKLFCPQAH